MNQNELRALLLEVDALAAAGQPVVGSKQITTMTRDLASECDSGCLAEKFREICLNKNAVDYFHAMQSVVDDETWKTILNNVAAVFASEYKKAVEVKQLQHLFPLVMEAQKGFLQQKEV